MSYLTVKKTKELVVQDFPGTNEEGKVRIRHMYDGRIEFVDPSEVTRLRKYVCGKLLDCSYCGVYTDDKGVKWECYTPVGIELSAWVRLESTGRRPKMVYDPGNGFRKTLDEKVK